MTVWVVHSAPLSARGRIDSVGVGAWVVPLDDTVLVAEVREPIEAARTC